MKLEDLDLNKKYVDNRVSVLKIDGKLILCTDYSHLSGNGEKDFFKKIYKWTTSFDIKPNSVLNLVKGNGNKLNREILEALKKITSGLIKPYAKKSAVYGLSDLQRVFINALNKFSDTNIKIFKTKEDAIKWLIED